jgi:hypothetical protein
MGTNTDSRVILALVAMGRTSAESKRLLAAWDKSREPARLLAICMVSVCLTQLDARSLMPALIYIFNTQVPGLAKAARHALSPMTELITNLMPLTRMEELQ